MQAALDSVEEIDADSKRRMFNFFRLDQNLKQLPSEYIYLIPNTGFYFLLCKPGILHSSLLLARR
jgi:hypothetical protein